MNVKIGAEAAQFPEKEYINGIAFAVHKEESHPSCWCSVEARVYIYIYWKKTKYLDKKITGTIICVIK